MKNIIREIMLCGVLIMTCLTVSFAEEKNCFYRIFPCESGAIIAAKVSEEYGYLDVRIHVQYPMSQLWGSLGKMFVEEFKINGRLYSLEEVYVDQYDSGSRVDYSYRVTEFSGETMNEVSIVVVENNANGEQAYRIDLLDGEIERMNVSAIVQISLNGYIYDTPFSTNTIVGKIYDGVKLTVYFTTEDGWAAIGVGSREAELWGYMRIEDLCFDEGKNRFLMSGIEQLDVKSTYSVYEDSGCTHVLCDVQEGEFASILGSYGDICFIQTGSQYGYVPIEILRGNSYSASTTTSCIYKADVRGAIVTIQILHDDFENDLIKAEFEYTPRYTVNDDLMGLAIYVNGDKRYILSEEDDFNVRLPHMDKTTSLVVVPIWASGGEILEDLVIIPIFD